MTERIGAPLEEQIGADLKNQKLAVSKSELHDKLNGKQTPNITREAQVFAMSSVPSDALLHPARAALLRREALRQGVQLADQTTAVVENQVNNGLALQADIFQAPIPQSRRA